MADPGDLGALDINAYPYVPPGREPRAWLAYAMPQVTGLNTFGQAIDIIARALDNWDWGTLAQFEKWDSPREGWNARYTSGRLHVTSPDGQDWYHGDLAPADRSWLPLARRHGYIVQQAGPGIVNPTAAGFTLDGIRARYLVAAFTG